MVTHIMKHPVDSGNDNFNTTSVAVRPVMLWGLKFKSILMVIPSII